MRYPRPIDVEEHKVARFCIGQLYLFPALKLVNGGSGKCYAVLPENELDKPGAIESIGCHASVVVACAKVFFGGFNDQQTLVTVVCRSTASCIVRMEKER